ncbi:MAG: hypothetical protein ACJAVG_001319 [Rickettsiales bacterium]
MSALLIIFIIFSVNHLKNASIGEKPKSKVISNIKKKVIAKIIPEKKKVKIDNKPLDQNEILLKQQIQISDLRDDLNSLKLDVSRSKTNNNLPKIILTFIKLSDLVEENKPHEDLLRKLEILSKADFSLSSKVSYLRKNLIKEHKSQKELENQFSYLTSQIKAKKYKIENENSWSDKAKSMISRFVIIRKTNEKNQASDIDILILKIENNIEQKEYDLALENIDLVGDDYQDILVDFKDDLEKSANLERSFEDLYQYLEALSNQSP